MKEVYTRPSIENVDPYQKYQRSTPSAFSLQENPILYGGGRRWKLLLNRPFLLPNGTNFNVDVFTLNTSIIIWFLDENVGLEIPYQAVVLHALEKSATNQSVLYVQFSGQLQQEEELLEGHFTPDASYVGSEHEDLFLPEYFGANYLRSTLAESTFSALSKCSAFHCDPETDEENEAIGTEGSLDVGGENCEEMLIGNRGQADDIDECAGEGLVGVAGVEVDIAGPGNGIKRGIDGNDRIITSKARKL